MFFYYRNMTFVEDEGNPDDASPLTGVDADGLATTNPGVIDPPGVPLKDPNEESSYDDSDNEGSASDASSGNDFSGNGSSYEDSAGNESSYEDSASNEAESANNKPSKYDKEPEEADDKSAEGHERYGSIEESNGWDSEWTHNSYKSWETGARSDEGSELSYEEEDNNGAGDGSMAEVFDDLLGQTGVGNRACQAGVQHPARNTGVGNRAP